MDTVLGAVARVAILSTFHNLNASATQTDGYTLQACAVSSLVPYKVNVFLSRSHPTPLGKVMDDKCLYGASGHEQIYSVDPIVCATNSSCKLF